MIQGFYERGGVSIVSLCGGILGNGGVSGYSGGESNEV